MSKAQSHTISLVRHGEQLAHLSKAVSYRHVDDALIVKGKENLWE